MVEPVDPAWVPVLDWLPADVEAVVVGLLLAANAIPTEETAARTAIARTEQARTFLFPKL